MRPFHKRTEGRLDLDRRRGLPVTNAFPVTNAAGAAPPLRREKRDDRVRGGRSLSNDGGDDLLREAAQRERQHTYMAIGVTPLVLHARVAPRLRSERN
jgi:hypothetical protein